MVASSRYRVRLLVSRHVGVRLKLSLGCAGLALLSACASSRPAGQEFSTNYYIEHAAHNYTPPGPSSDPWGPYINIAASHFDVPAMWIRQVMRVESGGHEYIGGQLTVSGAGAMGLMQLEPETYQEMASRYGLGNDPFNPYDNIMAGAAYIHEMYQIYGSPGFLAAYNAGPGRLDSYVNGRRRLPSETVNYVAMIAPNIQGYYPAHRSGADQLALNTQSASDAPGILPPGFVPAAPGPVIRDSSPPVRVASIAPVARPAAQVYVPPPARVASVPMPPPAPTPPPQMVASTNSAIYASAPVEAAYIPPPPPPSPHRGFSLIPAAMADTPPAAADLPSNLSHSHEGWAIQVGAYDSSSNAKAALGIAEITAVQMLVNGRAMVVSVHTQGHVKYRARVVGLQHDDAVNACNRLSGGPTGCMVLPPEAQS